MTEEKSVRKQVSNEEFVDAYVECSYYDELATKLGLTEASVASRANKLRKLGINLPKYGKQKRIVDINALNERIAAKTA